MTLDQLYAEQLADLRELGSEFAQANPAAAPLLNGQAADPDVERLLQGLAFLSAMVRQKLNDDMPELVSDMADLVGADLVAPMPSLCVLQLSAGAGMSGGYALPAATPFGSTELDGVRCRFVSSWPLLVQPLRLTGVQLTPQGRGSRLALQLRLNDGDAAQWSADRLSLFLGGPVDEAALWLHALRRHGGAVRVRIGEAASPLRCEFVGLDPERSLFAAPPSLAPHLRWLRECQFFPERHFFVDLVGLTQWRRPPGEALLHIEFDLELAPTELPKPEPGHFVINAVPAANLFDAWAEPIDVTQLKESYPLRVAGLPAAYVDIQDVLGVTGRRQAQQDEHEYHRYASPLGDESSRRYQTVRVAGVQPGRVAHRLRVPVELDEHGQPLRQTLSVRLRCTNGRLAERLRIGQVGEPIAESPERVRALNVTTPTAASPSLLGDAAMWRLVAHARLNLQALADAEVLREHLGLYLPQGGDPARLAAARRRIEGIRHVECQPEQRLLRGGLVRGQQMTLQLDRGCYAGAGDLMAYGETLAHYLAGMVAINSYISVTVVDLVDGRSSAWPFLVRPGLTL